MDLATKVSKLPGTSQKEIVDAFGDQRDHQQEIRDGQVHHEHVSRGPQWRKATQNSQYHPVSANGHNTLIPVKVTHWFEIKIWRMLENVVRI